MIDEQIFKEKLLIILNKDLVYKDGYKDGDKEKNIGKKVDIINHKSKIAIEIKDDTIHKTIIASPENPFVSNTTYLKRMSTIILDHIRDARLKFNNYKGYKTILLFRTEHRRIETIKYCIEGLDTFTKDGYIGRIPQKYSHHIKENIGCYIISNYESKFFYFNNPFCKNQFNIVSKEEAASIFKQEIIVLN